MKLSPDDTPISLSKAKNLVMNVILNHDLKFGRIRIDGFEFIVQDGRIHNIVQEIEETIDGKQLQITKRHTKN